MRKAIVCCCLLGVCLYATSRFAPGGEKGGREYKSMPEIGTLEWKKAHCHFFVVEDGNMNHEQSYVTREQASKAAEELATKRRAALGDQKASLKKQILVIQIHGSLEGRLPVCPDK